MENLNEKRILKKLLLWAVLPSIMISALASEFPFVLAMVPTHEGMICICNMVGLSRKPN